MNHVPLALLLARNRAIAAAAAFNGTLLDRGLRALRGLLALGLSLGFALGARFGAFRSVGRTLRAVVAGGQGRSR